MHLDTFNICTKVIKRLGYIKLVRINTIKLANISLVTRAQWLYPMERVLTSSSPKLSEITGVKTLTPETIPGELSPKLLLRPNLLNLMLSRIEIYECN